MIRCQTPDCVQQADCFVYFIHSTIWFCEISFMEVCSALNLCAFCYTAYTFRWSKQLYCLYLLLLIFIAQLLFVIYVHSIYVLPIWVKTCFPCLQISLLVNQIMFSLLRDGINHEYYRVSSLSVPFSILVTNFFNIHLLRPPHSPRVYKFTCIAPWVTCSTRSRKLWKMHIQYKILKQKSMVTFWKMCISNKKIICWDTFSEYAYLV